MNDIIYILFAHFLGDFVCQTRWQAENKSSNEVALLYHIGSYALTLFVMCALYFGDVNFTTGFVMVNAFLHYLTDFVTSRLSSHFYKTGKNKAFWTTIGFDQFVHAASLIYTYNIL